MFKPNKIFFKLLGRSKRFMKLKNKKFDEKSTIEVDNETKMLEIRKRKLKHKKKRTINKKHGERVGGSRK
jgi:hypothetical protein